MNVLDLIAKNMVDRAFEDWVTPKYLYRAITPLGKIIEVEGKGDIVHFPDKLIKKLWFWRFLGRFSELGFKIYIERKEINKYKETKWQQVFYWPASKLLANRK